MSVEAKQAYTELKVLGLIILECGASMNECPSSVVFQILSRSLRFYGHNLFHRQYFTKLIDQYYNESALNCSLILPYQFLDSPGQKLVFELNKHEMPITHTVMDFDKHTYLITLSNKVSMFNINTLIDMGEIHLSLKKKYKHFFVYFHKEYENMDAAIKDVPGGFLACSEDDELVSYSFDSTLLFKRHFHPDVVTDMYQIGQKYFMIGFKNKNYIEVYNLFTGEFVLRHTFELPVSMFICNSYKKYVNKLDKKHKRLRVFVVLSSMQSKLLELDSIANIFILCGEFESPGFRVTSLFHDHTIGSTRKENLIICLGDFSYVKMPWSYDKDSQACNGINYSKIKNFIKSKNVRFKFLDKNEDYYLCLRKSDGCLFMQELDGDYSIKTEENFDNGCFLENWGFVGCKPSGVVCVYAIIDKNYGKFSIKLCEFQAHNQRITWCYSDSKSIIFS